MALEAGERNTPVSQTSPLKWMEEHALFDKDTGHYIRFFGPMEPPDLAGASDTEIVVVIDSASARLDNIAEFYLGDRNLWWVIALYNDMDLPEAMLYQGLEVHIPNRQWVQDNVINLPRTLKRTV